MLLRVTPDTNIYISALNFGGMPQRFLQLAEAGCFQLVISASILTELRAVLRGEKFAWPAQEIERSLRQLSRFTQCVHPSHTLHVVTVDPSDNRILECADAGKVDYIVSGDKHLLRLKQHGDMPIIKLSAFMKLFQEQADR